MIFGTNLKSIVNISVKLFVLKKCILFFFGSLSFYLILSLITFDPFDDTYLQYTGNDFVRNTCGKLGAICADILFFIFGCVAYLLSCMIFFLCVFFLNNESLNFFSLSFKIFWCIVLLFSSCGLIEFFVDDFYYCFSGGVVGNVLRVVVLHNLFNNDIIVNVIFLVFVILGIFLIFKNSKEKYFLCKNFFLNLEIKLKNVRNRFKILMNKFHLDQSFTKIKKFQIRRISNIRNNDILHRIYFYINCIMYYLKNIYYISMTFDISKFLFFKKSQMHNLNFNAVSLSSVKLYCEKFFNYVVHSIVFKNKVTEFQKLISTQSMIKQLLPPIHTAQIDKMKFVKKHKSLKNNSELLPSIDLLYTSPFLTKFTDIDYIMETKSRLLESKLSEYNIRANVVNVLRGPVVTRFELELGPGLKSSRISSLSRDLARSLSVSNLRIIEIIPGKPYVGLEIPNDKRETIYLREILDSDKFRMSRSFLTLGFGKDVAGIPVVADLIDMPHLLIAGTTGSGKSVGINNMIISILYKASPENVRFIMIDSKILELSIYNGIPHLIRSVVTDINHVINVLNWCVKEMQRRYKVMAYCGVRNLKSYNDRVQSGEIHTFSTNNPSVFMLKMLPHIVIVVDEFADLVLFGSKEVESLIVCLSQKSRACGMHLILATQRPSVNVITGLIKANIPSRIAFTVSSKVDSRIILDQSGAESLLGMGDMLYLGPGSSIPIRIHGAFVSDGEVSLVVKHWQNIFNKNNITG